MRAMEDDPLCEIAHNCVLMRTRHLSRAVGALYQRALDPFGVSAAQFVLLMSFTRIAAPAACTSAGSWTRTDQP